MAVIHGIVIDCAHPLKLAEFWREALGYEYRMKEDDWCSLRAPGRGSPFLSFATVPEDKVVKNRVHLDIRPKIGSLNDERERIKGWVPRPWSSSTRVSGATTSWPTRKATSSAS